MGMTDIQVQSNNVFAENKLSRIYSISDLFTIMLALHNINSNKEDKDQVKKQIWALTNMWLEEVSPLSYIPGLVEEVSSIIKYKVWDEKSTLSDEVIERILVDTIIFKEKALSEEEPEVLNALSLVLATRAVELIEALGGYIPRGSTVWKILYEPADPRDKIIDITTLIATTLVISTNV